MIYFPCEVDGVEYHNLREAHRAVFLKAGIGYDRFQRRLKRGDTEFLGHSIRRVRVHYAIDRPREPDSDGVDLIPVPAVTSPKKEHKRGEPLIRYPPGEGPLSRGLPERWH